METVLMDLYDGVRLREDTEWMQLKSRCEKPAELGADYMINKRVLDSS